VRYRKVKRCGPKNIDNQKKIETNIQRKATEGYLKVITMLEKIGIDILKKRSVLEF
jgi:hypothetical protein